jgi:superfamily II DNA/RNA helicase
VTAGFIQVAVATIAFGMGIDLAHVRYVVHWSLAKTVEGFYQESGRAGRDGLPALSVLYFSKDEASKFSYLIQQQNNSRKDAQTKKLSTERSLDALHRMVNYCITPCCRRQYLLEHFGEKVDVKHVCNRTCDYCQNPKLVEKRIDASHVVKDVIDTSKRSGNKRPGSPAKWDGQWSKPPGDDDEGDDWQDKWAACDLGITSYADSRDFEAAASSVARMPRDKCPGNSASILDKYEVPFVLFPLFFCYAAAGAKLCFWLSLLGTGDGKQRKQGFCTIQFKGIWLRVYSEHCQFKTSRYPRASMIKSS